MVPASGSDSRSNIRSSIYQLVVRSQAYQRDRSVGWTVGVAQSLSGWVVVRYECLVAIVVECKARLLVSQ